jgi:hypothetical protein
MSKFEIIQSNRVAKEVKIINDILDEMLEVDKQKHLYEHVTFNI